MIMVGHTEGKKKKKTHTQDKPNRAACFRAVGEKSVYVDMRKTCTQKAPDGTNRDFTYFKKKRLPAPISLNFCWSSLGVSRY